MALRQIQTYRMLIANPVDENTKFGVLSIYRNCSVYYLDRWYDTLYEMSKKIPLETCYFQLFLQYPSYIDQVCGNNIALEILGIRIQIDPLCSKVRKELIKLRDRTANPSENIIRYIQIIERSLEYENLESPSIELIHELLEQNGMKKQKEYLQKDLSGRIDRSTLKKMMSLPYTLEVNKIIYYLSFYKKIPTKYVCRPVPLSFRDGKNKKPLTRKQFIEKVGETDLDPKYCALVRENPENYSMYDVLKHLSVRSKGKSLQEIDLKSEKTKLTPE